MNERSGRNIKDLILDKLPIGPGFKKHLKRISLRVKVPLLKKLRGKKDDSDDDEWGGKITYNIPF